MCAYHLCCKCWEFSSSATEWTSKTQVPSLYWALPCCGQRLGILNYPIWPNSLLLKQHTKEAVDCSKEAEMNWERKVSLCEATKQWHNILLCSVWNWIKGTAYWHGLNSLVSTVRAVGAEEGGLPCVGEWAERLPEGSENWAFRECRIWEQLRVRVWCNTFLWWVWGEVESESLGSNSASST